MAGVKQLRLCGLGGQGLVLGGMILGKAAAYDGKYVAGSDSYGVRVRGGYALSDLVVSGGPIVYPHVLEPDILVPMAQEAYEEHVGGVGRGGIVIYDEQLVRARPIDGLSQVGIPATSRAIRDLKQKQAANVLILGAVAAITGIVSRDSLERAVKDTVNERFLDANLKGVDLGYRIGEEKWRLQAEHKDLS
ncbi:MAG: 2-oxoacid:acceptor oxidoreductase family protein [Deltaproteobacteria bacterium]|nr:2-oxoacid:acceptor oxidoreductase family protein [Deltaproteobacteria bacterium]MBW2016033.1 2-oxoacid:acceptor oxidoreductase family protein [Deltaproteobacteria bacterium]MBW2128330.1 2-oxoacid:acceptor oxidoreductase family protein [Deltaproteobacteria bacterium]MBW2302156.1 2-oxoacid:acceptor oxidoreductase family protein [Deltaproteobacteria bacterium]